MEIQKIFSEQGGEDKIYSVLLSESEYEIYQKEFGLIRDLRKRAAIKLTNSIRKDFNRVRDGFNVVEKNKIPDSVIKQKLIEKADKKGVDVLNLNIDGKGPQAVIGIDKEIPELRGRVRSNVIFFPNSDKEEGLEGLAHELGHIENYNRGGLSKRVNQKATNLSKGFVNDSEKISKTGGDYRKSGVVRAAKQYIGGKLILHEEKSASKKGLDFLRELGANNDQIKKAKRSLNGSLETYKGATNARWKSTLKNTIKPKKD